MRAAEAGDRQLVAALGATLARYRLAYMSIDLAITSREFFGNELRVSDFTDNVFIVHKRNPGSFV